MSSDTRERVDRHGEERARTAVLEMTRAVLGEVGYQRLRVEAVAARAGVPRAWLRRWWTTRPLLVAEALQRMDVPTDIVPTGDVRVDVHKVVSRTAEFLADPLVADALAGLVADAARDPVAAERLTTLLAARRAADSAVLLSATARGDLRGDTDVPLLLDLVFGTLLVRAHRGEPPTAQVVDTLVELVLRGQAAATEPADEHLADAEAGAPLDGQPPDGFLLEHLPLAGPLPRAPLDGAGDGRRNGQHAGQQNGQDAAQRSGQYAAQQNGQHAAQRSGQYAAQQDGQHDGAGSVSAW